MVLEAAKRQVSYQGQREDKPARQVVRLIPHPQGSANGPSKPGCANAVKQQPIRSPDRFPSLRRQNDRVVETFKHLGLEE